jgi:Bacterial Ig domain
LIKTCSQVSGRTGRSYFNSIKSLLHLYPGCLSQWRIPTRFIFFSIVLVFASVLFFLTVFSQLAYSSHCVQYYPEVKAIALLCGSANLFDIADQVASEAILSHDPIGNFVLKSSLVIGNSATLNINSTTTSSLIISPTNSDLPYHISVLGNLNIDSVKISACDSHRSDSIDNGSIPRPYITILPSATGNVTVTNSEISCLGYDFPQREGLSVFGGHANFSNNKINDQYYGIFALASRVTSSNNTFVNNIHNFSFVEKPSMNNKSADSDLARPFVAIKTPVENNTFTSTRLEVEGTAFDEQSGVKQVEIFEHTFPFDNKFPYKPAEQVQNGSWLSWKYAFNLTKAGVHRISVRATDNVGNENWAEVLFNVSPFLDNSTSRQFGKRIALVGAVFTDGAYNKGGFYEFYPKYGGAPEGEDIYTNLDLLTSNIPNTPPFDPVTSNATKMLRHLLQNVTKGPLPILSDEDLHEGHIFTKNGSNAYDVLFMLHEEYVTKQEYMNLKRFVYNGGVIVFVDSNVLYAQVLYNPDMHSVTLLRGHDWIFNGKFAEKNVRERWFNENKDWMGSNFLWGSIDADTVFANNPFNYTHFEENYVANPDNHIIYDYQATVSPELMDANSLKSQPQIASYSLEYGKGKVIMLGLFGQHLLENPSFNEFLEEIIFPQAAGSKFYINGSNSPIYYHFASESGNLSSLDVGNSNLSMKFERTANSSDDLLMSIPIQLVHPTTESASWNITILLDGKKVEYSAFKGYNDLGLRVHFNPESRELKILTSS